MPIPGSPVRLLGPTDNLLQVALHTAKHSFLRAPGLRLHLDVDRIVRRQDVNWDAFVHQVNARQLRTPVYFSLAIPAALFGTPIPAQVISAVSPSAWKKTTIGGWIRRAGLLEPSERKFNRAGYILFVALLYDGLGSLARALLPPRDRMSRPGRPLSGLQLGAKYASRLVTLALRRHTT